MKGIVMEPRKNKFKAFVNKHPRVVLASATVLTIGITIALKASCKPINGGTSDGVPEELWDEMMAVAKKMDDAVAENKAKKED
jgi:hypothetical protein